MLETFLLDNVLLKSQDLKDFLIVFESYIVEETSPGQWQIVIRRDDESLSSVSFSAYAAMESELTLTLSTDGEWHKCGQEIIITAALSSPAGPVTEVTVEAEGLCDIDLTNLRVTNLNVNADDLCKVVYKNNN